METAARKVPSPYTCPETCAADIFRTLYTEKGIQPTEVLLTATGQFFRIESLNTLQCYPASIDTLQNLHTKGCGVYLLSNAQRIFTEYELRSLGLWELFDGILISSDEGCCKPDPPDRILITRKLISPGVFHPYIDCHTDHHRDHGACQELHQGCSSVFSAACSSSG